MVHLQTDLPEDLLRRVLIASAEAGMSVEEWFTRALETSLLPPVEEPVLIALPELGGEVDIWRGLRISDLLEMPEDRFVPPAPLTDAPLWGQVNRLLPLKVAVRALWSQTMEDGEAPTLQELRVVTSSVACALREPLKEIDAALELPRGARLHASFPKREVRSIERFQNNFVGRVARSGSREIAGAIFDFGFAAVDRIDGRIRLTELGLAFARLPNPLIDRGENMAPGLDEREQILLIETIRSRMPEEWRLMRLVLNGILGHADTTDALAQRMLRLYGPGTEWDWSNSTITAMRSGVLARLQGLGLIDRTYSDRNVCYSLTERGRRVVAEG